MKLKLAEAVKAIKNNTLTEISLDYKNKIGSAGAKDLALALKDNHTLTKISLDHNEISAAGAKALVLALALKDNDTLTEISLYDNNIGAVGTKELALALKDNHTLTSINLGTNDIDSAVAKDIALALKNNHTLTSINLSWNSIRAASAKGIILALKDNHTLTSIDLSHNGIGGAGTGTKELALALKDNHTLTSISLWSNDIGPVGAKELALALKDNDTLTSINLSLNDIGPVGTKDIILALKNNNTLTSMDLSHNGIIGAAGAKDIIPALKGNHTLTSINLRKNGLSDADAKDLILALKDNDTLTEIGLSSNSVDAASAKEIILALKDNDTLTSINLRKNDLSDAGAKDIALALKDNHTLTSIDLSKNDINKTGIKKFFETLATDFSHNTVLTNIFIDNAEYSKDWPEVKKILLRNQQAQQKVQKKEAALSNRFFNLEQKLNMRIDDLEARKSSTTLADQVEGWTGDNLVDNETLPARVEQLVKYHLMQATNVMIENRQTQEEADFKLFKEICNEHTQRIEKLQSKIKQSRLERKFTSEDCFAKQLNKRIKKLKVKLRQTNDDLKPLRKKWNKKQEQLNDRKKLFKYPNSEAFYTLVLFHLEAFYVGLYAVQSQLLTRKQTKGEKYADYIFDTLGLGVGLATAFVTLGITALFVPVVVAASRVVANETVGRIYDKKMERSYRKATKFGPTLFAANEASQQLALLVTEQLRYHLSKLTEKGIKTLAQAWVKGFRHNLFSRTELENLPGEFSQLKSTEKYLGKTTLETHYKTLGFKWKDDEVTKVLHARYEGAHRDDAFFEKHKNKLLLKKYQWHLRSLFMHSGVC